MYKLKIVASASLCAVALSIMGCGRGTKTVPVDALKGAIATSLPPFVSLESLETEDTGAGGVFNLKAVIKPRETLYVAQPADDFPFGLIAESQKQGIPISLYGRAAAERVVDKWTIHTVEFSPPVALGKPRSAFNSVYIVGTPEAQTAVDAHLALRAAQRKADADEAERSAKLQAERAAVQAKLASERAETEAKELAAMRERQRIDNEEQRQKDEAAAAAYKNQLLTAMRVGRTYIGILTEKRESKQAIEMRVVEQSGFMVAVEFRNPDRPAEHTRWRGELTLSRTPGEAQIKLGTSEQASEGWNFHTSNREGHLHLNLDSNGQLAGKCTRGYPYTIRLQPTAN